MPEYTPSKTLEQFHQDDSIVRAVIGAIGSGKSVGCCMEVLHRAYKQEPNKSGVRKSRWAVVRNTYRELMDTTIKTWMDWLGADTGVFKMQDLTHTITGKLDDGTSLHLEVMFRALDRPNDVKKLLSLELTGMWLNEAREIPKEILEMGIGRVGRFPSKRDGGASWYGVILDTNPPDSDHWFYKLFEENRPDTFKIFHQPSGLSPEAENLENLPTGYYDNMIAGKDQEWINVYVHGQYGFIADGKPVFPEYKDGVHSTLNPIEIGKQIYVGIDFGLTPAAVIGQKAASGQIQVIDELVTEDMGAVNFGRILKELLNTKYVNCKIEIYADPAGEQRSQTDEVTPFQILWNQGINAWPCYTNDFTIRREAVADYMQRLDFSGNPAFLLGPECKTLRKALGGGYKYRRMQVTGEARWQDKPDKGRYSHVADALQYMCLGAVGGGKVVGGYDEKDIDYSATNRMIA